MSDFDGLNAELFIGLPCNDAVWGRFSFDLHAEPSMRLVPLDAVIGGGCSTNLEVELLLGLTSLNVDASGWFSDGDSESPIRLVPLTVDVNW